MCDWTFVVLVILSQRFVCESDRWVSVTLCPQVLESSAGMLLRELLPLKRDSLCEVFPHLSPSDLRMLCHRQGQVVHQVVLQVHGWKCCQVAMVEWEHAPSLSPSVLGRVPRR